MSAGAEASILARARAGDEDAIATMFGQLLGAEDRIVAARYLGVQGFWGLGTHSFGCVTNRRVAALRVTIFGGIEYQEAALEHITSGGVHQPTRLRLIGWVAAVFLFLLVVGAPRAGLLVGLAVAAVLTAFLFPLIVRLFYRRHKCGLVLSVREGLDLFLFSDRKLLGRANEIYRRVLTERERRVRPWWTPQPARPMEAPPPQERATPHDVRAGAGVPVVALALLGAVVVLAGAGFGIAAIVGGDDEESASSGRSGAPAGTTVDRPEPEPTLSADEQILVDYVGDDVTDCVSAPVAEGSLLQYGEAIAGITCSIPGADEVNYFLYRDVDTMNREFRAQTDTLPRGQNCEDEWGIYAPWNYEGETDPVGRIACYDASDDSSVIEWTEDREGTFVYGYMHRADGAHASLYRAWQRF